MHNDLMDTLAVYCCCCFESATDLTNVTENGSDFFTHNLYQQGLLLVRGHIYNFCVIEHRQKIFKFPNNN